MLQKERDKAQSFLDISGVMLVANDREANITLINRKGCEVMGYEEKDMIGRQFYNFLPKSIRNESQDIYEKLMRGEIESFEYSESPILTKDGEERIIAWHNTILREEGKIIGTLSSGEDVTERKKAEEALLESESRYRTVVENAGEGISVVQDGLLRYINPHLAEIMGYSEKEYMSRPFIEFVHPDDREWAMGIHMKRFKGEEVPHAYEFRAVNKQGHTIWMENNGILIEWSGRPASLNFLRDITDRKKVAEALRQERDRAQKYLDVAGVMFVHIDTEGKVALVNKKGCDILGYQEEEIVGKNWFDNFLPAENREVVKEVFFKLIAEEIEPVEYYENPIFTKDGEERIIAWHNTILWEEGKIVGTLSSGEDITDRKKAEDALRKSEERLKILFDSAPDAYYTHDLEGKFVDGNRAAEELLGYQKEEAVGKSFFELGMVTEADVPKSMAAIAENREGKPAGPLELMLNHKDGSNVMVETRSYPVDIAGETLILGIARDITERKEAEQKIKSSEERFKVLFEYAPDAYYMTDLQGRFVDGNRAAEQTIGYKKEELIGKNFLKLKLISLGQMPKAAKLLARNVLGQPTGPDEFVLNRKDGTKVDVEIRTYPVQINGQALVLGIARDITERKKAEQALRAERDKLQALMDGINRAGIGIDIIGADYKVLFQNQTLEDRFGKIHGEPCYEHYIELEEPCDRCTVTEAIQQNAAVEIEQRGHDGRDYQIFTAPVPEADGSVNKAIEIVLDITERKQSEEKLRQKDYIIESASSAIATTDLDGKLTYANPAFLEMWGYDNHDEFLGKLFNEFWIVADKLDKIMDTLRNEGKWTDEIQARRKDGSIFDVQVFAATVRDTQGNPVCLMSSSVNVTERKLAEAECARLIDILETTSDFVYTSTPDGEITYLNRAGKRMLGWQEDENCGGREIPDIHPDWAFHVIKNEGIPAAIEHGVWEGETALLRSDDTEIPASQVIMSHKAPDGEVDYFSTIIRDITERKQAVEALRESEERFRALFEQAAVGVAQIVTETGQFVRINQKYCDIVGYSREEMEGHTFQEITHHDDLKADLDNMEKLVQGQIHEFSMEKRYCRKDGSIVWVNLTVSPMWRAGEEPDYHIAVVEDITERKIVEEKVRESEKNYRSLFEGGPDGIIIADMDTGQYIHVNPAVCQKLGYTEEEIKAVSQFRGIHPKEETERIEHLFYMQAKGEISIAEDIPFVKKDGTIRYFDVNSVHVEFNGVRRVVALLRDITERKLVEAERARLIAILATTSDFVSTSTPDGELTYVNRAGKRMLGWPEDESCNGREIPDGHPDWAFHIVKNEGIPAAIEYGVWEGETALLRPDGTEIPVSQVIMAHKASDDKVEYFSTIIRDITERKQAEKALKQSEERFRSLSEAAFEGIAFGEKGVLVDANDAFIKMYGYSLEELKGRQVMELVSPEHHELVLENIRSGYEGVYEHKGIRKDGSLIDLEIHGRNVIYQGRTMRLTAIRDITERKQAEEELRQYDHIVSSSTDMMALLDKRFTYIAANASYLENFKKTRDEVIGYTAAEVFGEEFFETVIKPNAERCLAGEHVNYQAWFDFSASEQRYMDINYYPYIDTNNEILGFVVNGRNITEHKRAEEKLRESEERLTKAFRASPNLMGIVDLDERRRLLGNDAFARITGYSLEEATGTTFDELNFWIEPERVHEAFQLIRQDGVLQDYETNIRTKQGEIRTLTYNAVLLDIPGKNIVAFSAEDITDRKRAEEKLNKTRGLLLAAIEQTPAGIIIADAPDVNIRAANAAALGIRGESTQPLTQIPVEFHPENWQTFHLDGTPYKPEDLPLSKAVLHGITTKNKEVIIRREGSEDRWVLANAAPVLDAKGQVIAGIVVFPDITERKIAESRLQDYQRQLKSLASELSLAEERERRRIAAGIHDDIAQKLAMAKFELQSLQASVTDTNVSGSLEKQCQLMDQVVADARSLTFELSNPVLYQVGLEAAVESYLTERIQGQFGITCKFKSEGPRASLGEDIRVVLFQAVRELLANIVKHASASTIEVCVSNTEDKLRIVVQDDGVGFDPTEIGPHTMEQGGFGLFNIRERLEYLGGNLEIESRSKSGTRVTMTVNMRTDAIAE